jgi:hypothetical protein
MSLQLKDTDVIVDNDSLFFPISLRDDEQMYLVSSAPVSSVPKAIAVERITLNLVCQVN